MSRKRSVLNKEEIKFVVDELERLYPNAKAELNFTNPFELLIATILSAQCTDIRVNIITKELFRVVKVPLDIINLGIFELEKMIKTCGLSKTKSKNIYNSCIIINNDYAGKVPSEFEELLKLPGVGRKTANVVVSNAFNTPAIAVDTHVQRVSNRLGISNSSDVLKTEMFLRKKIKKEKWTKMHHCIIYHGRRVCKARNPKCMECTLNSICLFNLNNV
ncbi:endonuclease III [Helicovermis profundi]|uniref:Endonuclease III n=1 Tax=Helicovermis profundi TaxID=3065157 RepID=A0AAU9EQF2_9FIRM|nr:hypothetical protein HLPR_10360 [Clostridia bacterium S502]